MNTEVLWCYTTNKKRNQDPVLHALVPGEPGEVAELFCGYKPFGLGFAMRDDPNEKVPKCGLCRRAVSAWGKQLIHVDLSGWATPTEKETTEKETWVVLWDNGRDACGELAQRYDTQAEAEAAGEVWANEANLWDTPGEGEGGEGAGYTYRVAAVVKVN